MSSLSGYQTNHREALLDLALRAWSRVFPELKQSVPTFVYECFWPQGWETRQHTDLARLLDEESENIDVAIIGKKPVGWMCTRIHHEDKMLEIFVLVVDPNHQRQGIGKSLLDQAKERAKRSGMSMIMVETGDDPGHLPARGFYEDRAFERWPVARYFLNLHD